MHPAKMWRNLVSWKLPWRRLRRRRRNDNTTFKMMISDTSRLKERGHPCQKQLCTLSRDQSSKIRVRLCRESLRIKSSVASLQSAACVLEPKTTKEKWEIKINKLCGMNLEQQQFEFHLLSDYHRACRWWGSQASSYSVLHAKNSEQTWQFLRRHFALKFENIFSITTVTLYQLCFISHQSYGKAFVSKPSDAKSRDQKSMQISMQVRYGYLSLDFSWMIPLPKFFL